MKYRVYKGYRGVCCINKFDNLGEAIVWCKERVGHEPYRIEWVEDFRKEVFFVH